MILRNADGRHLDATLNEDGDLIISGQDLGDAVEQFWGAREYEFAWTIPSSAIPDLLRALGAKGDVLEAVKARFSGEAATEIGPFLTDHEIEHSFWSRVGD